MSSTALIIDATIILLYFAAVTVIGLYMGRREESLEDYALGGRKVPWWAVMASIIAAETSAATFIGGPAEGFATRGLTYVQLTIGVILGRLLVSGIFLKPYYTYRVYTVYDFLAIRFGPMTKNYVSALFLLMRVLASGVRLYVPSLVLVLAWRLFALKQDVHYQSLDHWQPYAWAIAILTFITCVYTMLGGIKAVIWTDVIQASLMFFSALVAIVTILWKIGDGNLVVAFSTLYQHVPELGTAGGYFLTGFENTSHLSGWELLKHLLENKYTLPAAVIGATALNMAAFGTDQDMVQRLLTAKDYRRSRRSLVTAALMDVPIYTVFSFIGVVLIAFYALHPDLRPHKDADVFGAFILRVMPPGIRGIVLAGVFATAMGSLSAALNALATSLTNDWYTPYFAPNKREGHYVTAARIFTGLFAVLMVVVAVAFAVANTLNPRLTIIPVVLGVAGYILGPMLGVFMLGMITRTRGSDKGNLLAVSAGLLAIFIVSGRMLDVLNYLRPADQPPLAFADWMPKIEFTWYAFIGAMVTFLIGLLFPTPPVIIESAKHKACSPSS